MTTKQLAVAGILADPDWARTRRALGHAAAIAREVAAVVAGKFATTNKGNKVIIDTNGSSNQFTPGDVIVRFRDTGPGIPPQDRDRVIERFDAAEA